VLTVNYSPPAKHNPEPTQSENNIKINVTARNMKIMLHFTITEYLGKCTYN